LKDNQTRDELLIGYALGKLDEPEQERVEQKIFADKDFFERLLVVEDDLIDAYASGRLAEDDRNRFEKYFLKTIEDRERVEFARDLAALASRESRMGSRPSRVGSLNPWRQNRFKLVPLAASVLLLFAVLWLVFQNQSLGRRIEHLDAEKTASHARAADLEQQIAEERQRSRQALDELSRAERDIEHLSQSAPRAFGSNLISVVLTLGAVRDAGAVKRVVIPASARGVRFDARFRVGDYSGYSAEIQTVEGKTLWRRDGLKARKTKDEKSVLVIVPTRTFSENDYILVLNGISSTQEQHSVGEYFFRVTRDSSK
jgi:hypothetical protein